MATPSAPTRRSLLPALLASLALHGLAVASLAPLVGISAAGRGQPFATPPLTATLVATARYEVPVLPPAAPSPLAATAPAEVTPPLPVPLKPRPQAQLVKGSPLGMVTINKVPADQAVDPSVAARIAQFHPEAVRGTPEFDVQPRGIYPLAAVEKRQQIDFLIPIVVREDGRVEVVQGTFDDPLFGPVVRAGLAAARARPATDASGRTVPLWSVLSFAFEYAGERSAAK